MVEPYQFEFIYPSEFGGRTYRFRVRVERRRVQIEGYDQDLYQSGKHFSMAMLADPYNETEEDAVKFFREGIDYILEFYAGHPELVDIVTKSLPHEEITDFDDLAKLGTDFVAQKRSRWLGESPEKTALDIRIITEDVIRDYGNMSTNQN